MPERRRKCNSCQITFTVNITPKFCPNCGVAFTNAYSLEAKRLLREAADFYEWMIKKEAGGSSGDFADGYGYQSSGASDCQDTYMKVASLIHIALDLVCGELTPEEVRQ